MGIRTFNFFIYSFYKYRNTKQIIQANIKPREINFPANFKEIIIKNNKEVTKNSHLSI